MEKIKSKIWIFFFLLLLLKTNVHAIDIDTTKQGSINITATYSEKIFKNANIHIYHVADMNENGGFTYTNDFKGNKEIEEYKTSEWNELAFSLNSYIDEKKLNPTDTQTTDDKGICDFKNLTSGLYLVKMDTITEGDYQYSSSPSIISLPNYNEVTKEYIYDIPIIIKTESKYIGKTDNNEDNTTTNNNTTKAPNTFDNIMLYITLFTISIIGIIGLVFYKNRKEEVKK